MLEMIEIGIDNAVAFRMSGKITEKDMALVLSNAKKKIHSHGNIVILEVIESFKGIEIAALIEEFKYLYEVGMSNINKVAVITDKKWVENIVSIEDKIFKSVEIKCFSTEHQDSAIEFLKNT
ncbi:MAG: STAS/SEC14 domain-containing protein [Desulfobacteraceae bacterium]|nr:STAS/SEC14 domain-containing protein [Desulfobacteraceae bacterium]